MATSLEDMEIEDNSTTQEHRIYQEALVPHKVGNRVYHRYRFEQRFVQNRDFRMRVRYNLFADIPFNKPEMNKGAVYLALYNEIFVNTSKNIGQGRTVSIFDRNRLYGAIGYHILDNVQVRLGYMYQSLAASGKGQGQLSVHQFLTSAEVFLHGLDAVIHLSLLVLGLVFRNINVADGHLTTTIHIFEKRYRWESSSESANSDVRKSELSIGSP